MKLLTEEIRRKIPPLYSQENVKDPIVHVKFFTPWTNWTWYATEFDGKDVFFGWVVGLEKELGYFSLSEMESIRGPGGIGIERDMYFTPKPLSQVMAEHGEKWLMPQVRPPLKTGKKGPLFPHVPKSRVPLFPHTTKGRSAKVEYLPETEGTKHFWVEKNVPYDTWAVVEAFPGGTVRSPFNTKEDASKREYDIGQYYDWKLKQVPSPQEKFPKQHEALKKLYPYDILEYDDGDLTLQLLVPEPRPKRGFKPGNKVVVTTEGEVFAHYAADEALKKILGREHLPETIDLLAKVEGDPRGFVRKFCCRLCGECAPKELLEEGRFLDRISWLRSHYKEKHPGMWGKMSPMTAEGGEPLPPQYRDLVGLVSEPLPKEAE